MKTENEKSCKPDFKPGDKITLNTGYSCDKGVFLRWDGEKCVWRDKDGNVYKSPWTEYNITLQNS